MSEPVSEPDFDAMSWHDNIVYGLQFHVGDASQGGEIAFGGRGFTQVLRAEPVLLDEQWLPAGTPR